ncbi:MAG: ABC transporter ATP-binding protein [archaeon]
MGIIAFENVSKEYNGAQVLKLCSFQIKQGEACGIIGPSGCGKTTILKILSGLSAPTSGRILLNGINAADAILKNKKTIGYVFQESSLYDELTIFENFVYFASLYGMSKKVALERGARLLKIVGMEDKGDFKVSSLSGGMKKRADIACSILHNPELLILDEPLAGLDPIMRKQIIELIKKINISGITLVIADHLLSEIQGLCSRIIIIKQGKVVIEGTIDELHKKCLQGDKLHIKTRNKLYPQLVEILKMAQGIISVNYTEQELVILTSNVHETLVIILVGLKKIGDVVLDIDFVQPTLEDFFCYFEG